MHHIEKLFRKIFLHAKLAIVFMLLGGYIFLPACSLFGPTGEYIWRNDELYGKISAQEYNKHFKKASYACEIESLKIPLPSPNCVGSTNIDNSNHINVLQEQNQTQIQGQKSQNNSCFCDDLSFLMSNSDYPDYACPCVPKKTNKYHKYNSRQYQYSNSATNTTNQSGIYCDYTAFKHAQEAQDRIFIACMGLKGWEKIWREFQK